MTNYRKKQKNKLYSSNKINTKMVNKKLYLSKKRRITRSIKKTKPLKFKKYALKSKEQDKNKFKESSISPLEALALSTNSLLKIICSSCTRDITECPKFIIQAESQPEIICIKCFFQTKSKNSLNSTYSVVDKMDFPFFTKNWSLQDELRLLSSVEKLGLDNWDEIAKNIPSKGKLECESHYYTFYYKSKNDHFPSKEDIIIKNISKPNGYQYDVDLDKKNKKRENTLRDTIHSNQGTVPEFTNNSHNTHALNRSRSLAKNRNKKKNDQNELVASATEILGYWPKREEFDIEYLNDAELELSELEFHDNDTEEEFNSKMKILQIYNSQLDERFSRKKFVIDRNLFDIKKQIAFERKLNKEDREIYNTLKPFAKYLQNEEFQELFEGFILEKNLKQRLNQLLYYQSLGCRTYDDIHKMIDEKKNNKENFSEGSNGSTVETKKFLRNDNNFEGEKEFIKSVGIPRIVYNEIKKKIQKDVLNDKTTKELLNEKLLAKHDITQKKINKIIDYVIEFQTFDKSQKKIDK